MKIAILGGALSGLAVAVLLTEKGDEVEALDAEDEIRGLCRSEIRDGFVDDIGAGHVMYSKDSPALLRARFFHRKDGTAFPFLLKARMWRRTERSTG